MEMDTRTAIILQSEPDASSVAQVFLAPFKKRLWEIERDIDNIKRKLSLSETNLKLEREARARDKISWSQLLQEEKDARSRDVEWYISKMSVLEEEKLLLSEQIAELIPRPKEHWHDPDEPRPVMTFDLDGTLKPQARKGDVGNYPLTDRFSNPFSGTKKWLDRWKSRGACIHLATAGLYYDGPNGLEVYLARLSMLESWIKRYGLSIDLILPKIPADVYYDDRMIEVPGNPSLTDKLTPPPDWDEIGEKAEKEMERRFFIDEAGIWTRKEKKRVGEEIETWPDDKLFRDHPRGYSGPRIDVDMHRTLSMSSSSMRVASPREGSVEVMRMYYEKGITLTISCAGWNRQTHTQVDSIRRLAGIRQWLGQWSVPYDRVTEKDHADLYFDDKGVKFSDWVADVSKIEAKLPKPINYNNRN
jgi:hypothetical protein